MHLFAFTALAGFVLSAYAQTSNPFTVIGRLESLTLNANPIYNTGGQIVVTGRTITVPANLKVDFPAAYVPFRKLFNTEGTAPIDFPAPATIGYEVEVFGNRVDGQNIAGKISIGQGLASIADGFIESITYSNVTGGASIKIAGGPVLKISDPNAVFTAGWAAYPFWTADDESSSIVSFGGFPMCIPRVAPPEIDPLCPTTNRPNGGNNRAFIVPNANVMAPFAVGDFLTYQGVTIPGSGEVIVFDISANVGITTRAGTAPSFLAVEDNIVGVIDNSGAFESADTRWVGLVSDAAASVIVSVYALDVDPCSGEETERFIISFQPDTIAGDPRGKFDERTRKDVPQIGSYTREYKFKLSTGTTVTTNGLVSGQYVSPMSELIFPESSVPGFPTGPHEFDNFDYLSQGSGPDEDGNIFGQLSPWPGAFAPTIDVPACPTPTIPDPDVTFLPVASAGEDIVTRGGVSVTLSGSNTAPDIPESALVYTWTQTSGPTVTLSSTSVAKPTFTAPQAAGIVTCVFNLTITPTKGPASSDSVSIVTNSAAPDVVTIDSYTWVSRQSGTISVAAHSNVVSANSMSISLNNAGFVPMLSAGQGTFTYTSRNVAQNTPIRISSDLGGTASSSTPTAGRLVAPTAEEEVLSEESQVAGAETLVGSDSEAVALVEKRAHNRARRGSARL